MTIGCEDYERWKLDALTVLKTDARFHGTDKLHMRYLVSSVTFSSKEYAMFYGWVVGVLHEW
jgi:hypothetical protein